MLKIFTTLLVCFQASLFSTENRWNSFDHFPRMKEVYHPVTTTSPEAQKYFDLGLLAIYAFNHDAAFRFFEEAAHADSYLAMAYWGMALALGENLNRPISLEAEAKAYHLMKEAILRTKYASIKEKAYINALAHRYSNDAHPDFQKLRMDYKDAMKKLTLEYPDDFDAATLYAESMMDLRPWNLWTNDGSPVEGTLELVEVLDSVLKRNPDHLGANHYYIHAVEASKHPERALMSAHRLYDLLPEWGHILHMPSHIFFLVGDYEGAVQANKEAVNADNAYIRKYGTSGFYAVHYLSHNLFFLSRSYLWQEKYTEALQAAKDLEQFLLPHLEHMPDLEYYALAPLQVLLYSHNWRAILEVAPPKGNFLGLNGFWHFARSLAFLELGQKAKAEEEKNAFLKVSVKIPVEENLGYNSASTIFSIAKNLLYASFAEKKGDENERIRFLLAAIKLQDNLHYNEPPDWFYPIRQTLGKAFLEIKQFGRAEEVFRDALDKYPRNGRSLFGLFISLKSQQKDTYSVEREMKEALKNSEKTLNISDL